MDLHIGVIPIAPDEQLRALFAAMVDIDQRNHRCVFGHCDLATGSAETAQAEYLRQDDFRCHHLVAMDGPGENVDPRTVVGYASIWMSTQDNLDSALVGVCVDPEARTRGVGSALLAAVEDIATGDGRSVINTWSLHAPEAGRTRPTSFQAALNGPGRLSSDDPAARFFLRRGYALDQTHSTLQLDLTAGWKPEDRVGEQDPTGYEAVSWEGDTPAAYVLPMARLRTLMSTAAPSGSIEPDEQRWNAERV
ncbi:MAG: GNAT family N-acetyltransferase, partial [Friedmanniella sp.]